MKLRWRTSRGETSVTPKYPARSREPMVMRTEPMRKRTVARAMAL